MNTCRRTPSSRRRPCRCRLEAPRRPGRRRCRLRQFRPPWLMGGHGRDSCGHRVRLPGRPGCLTRRGVMSRRAAAHLSRRRSALRRCPSGEAQYCAGVSHPATPACFLFVMCIRSSSRVFEHHRYARLFFFPDSTNGLRVGTGSTCMAKHSTLTRTWVRTSGRGGEKLDGRKMLRDPLLSVLLL